MLLMGVVVVLLLLLTEMNGRLGLSPPLLLLLLKLPLPLSLLGRFGVDLVKEAAAAPPVPANDSARIFAKKTRGRCPDQTAGG